MATIGSKKIVDSIIAGSGWALDLDPKMEDTRVICIVEFTTPEGDTAWGLVYEGEDFRYFPSPYVRRPRTLWAASDEDGEDVLV